MSSLLDQIKGMLGRYKEIERLISDPTIMGDQARYSALMRERGQLNKVISKYEEIEKVRRQRAETEAMLHDSSNGAEMRRLIEEELHQLQQTEEELIRSLEELMLARDEHGVQNRLIMEIRPGTGGEEAALFASDLLRMYLKYIEKKGWRCEIMQLTGTDLGGVKQASFIVEGEDVYKYLRFEAGAHRVQRVPRTEAQGRIHTSACTVAVLPEVEEVDIQINREDLQIDTFRSGGAGGQHVNKVSSAVRITHLPTGITVVCQTERSQHRNRELAMRWLRAKLYDHFYSCKKAQRDQMRKTQVGTGDRSEKIRTYNFPQNRVTDHRVGHSIYDLEGFMNGDMDGLIERLRQNEREERLKRLAQGNL
jgi:peptide chain release factor 1